MHVVDGFADFDLGVELLEMVLEADLELVVAGIAIAVLAFWVVVHDVASKPLSIIQRNVKIDDLFVILLGLHVPRPADGCGVELRSGLDLSFI